MGNRQQQATNIDGPPPVFDPVKKEARFLSRNGDMTIVKFDSNNAAKTSVVKKWMDTAPYGPVTGFSQALNYYVVSFRMTRTCGLSGRAARPTCASRALDLPTQ